jgi:hypothetical protein
MFYYSKEKMYSEDDEGDETLKKDMLLRQARVLYPELEEWLLEMAVNMHLAQEKENERVKLTELTINDDY